MLDFTGEIMIIVMLMAGTLITRFLPFLLFPPGKEIPGFVIYLGKTLPYAAIGMLVVYCLRGISMTAVSHSVPQLIAVAVIIALHKWKHNSLLSIGAGTVIYMVLVQMVFV